jgi:hypothetical protein
MLYLIFPALAVGEADPKKAGLDVVEKFVNGAGKKK